jgi:hypothetical protein
VSETEKYELIPDNETERRASKPKAPSNLGTVPILTTRHNNYGLNGLVIESGRSYYTVSLTDA